MFQNICQWFDEIPHTCFLLSPSCVHRTACGSKKCGCWPFLPWAEYRHKEYCRLRQFLVQSHSAGWETHNLTDQLHSTQPSTTDR